MNQPQNVNPAFVIIGVGGGGRGAVNWIKYRLQTDGFPYERVHLLVIDGPVKDQYVLPGDFQIDTSQQSPEFYQFHLSPVGPVTARAKGDPVPYIDTWLHPDDARRIPAEHIEPRDGYGMVRIAGRTGLFQEASGVNAQIGSLLRKALADATKGGQSPTLNIFLVGSFSGGTGAGTLLDVAHLVRHQMQGVSVPCHFVGILLLPNAYGGVFTLPNEVVARDARSFAALRELMRAQGASPSSPVRISYAPNLSVENGQIFDLCYLIDGFGGQFQLGNIAPRDGVCAAAADFILSWLKDQSSWSSSVIGNFKPNTATQPANQRYADFGVHSLIFPEHDLLETFALQFAIDLYTAITTPPPTDLSGGHLAESVLQGIKFTQLAMNNERGRAIYEHPPVSGAPGRRNELFHLIQHFLVGKRGETRFPKGPSQGTVLALYDVVPVDTMLTSISNQEVIEQCDIQATQYIGKVGSTSARDVRGFLRLKQQEITEVFADAVIAHLEQICQDETGEPMTLDRKPHLLVEIAEFLDTLRTYLEHLRTRYQQAWDYYKNKEGVIDKQIEAVNQLRRVMLSGKPIDQTLQKQYRGTRDLYGTYQCYMELLIWDIMMNACVDLLGALLDVVNELDLLVGRTTYSWLNYLQRCREQLESRKNELVAQRRERARVAVRRYFPQPEDEAEKRMYEELIGISPGSSLSQAHLALLKEVRWKLYVPSGQYLPLQRVQEAKLVLEFPEVPGFDRQKYESSIQSLIAVFTGRIERLTLTTHSPDAVVQYGRNALGPSLNKKTIWDALAYDFQHVWLPQHSGVPQQQALKQYVSEVVVTLVQHANPLLGHTQAAAPRLDLCFADWLANASGLANAVRTEFDQQLKSRQGLTVQPVNLKNEVICLQSEYYVDITQWSYWKVCHENYRKYVRALPGRPDYIPPWVCPEERNAALMEEWLWQHSLINPLRPLHSSVVQYLGDLETFTRFSLVYAFGLLPVQKGQTATQSDRFYVDTGRVGGPVTLGEVWRMSEVLEAVFAPNNADVRRKISDMWHQHEQTYSTDFSKLKDDIIQRANRIQFAPVPVNSQDAIDRSDLKLAMQTAMLWYADAIR